MIEVNLLPQEYRRPERTPLPRFIVILIGVALVASLGSFLTKKLIDVRNEKNTQQELEQRLGLLKKQFVDRYDQLVAQKQEIEIRISAIETIWQSRLYWAVKLDQLADLVPIYVGLKDLKLEEPRSYARAAGGASGGTLFMSCISASENERRLANFRRILKGEIPPLNRNVPEDSGRIFYEDFQGEIEDFGYKITETDDYEEKEYIEFNLRMALKPRGQQAVTGVRSSPAASPAGAPQR